MSAGAGDEYQKLINEGVTKLLAVEAKIFRSLVGQIRGQQPFPTLCTPNNAVSPKQARARWTKKKRGLPDSLGFVDRWIQAGFQPVFCAMSFCFKSSSPTCYLPVPYIEAMRGPKDFLDTVILNADDAPGLIVNNLEETAREISHALLNISYEVRLSDDPVLGYLARAHKCTTTSLYIPDVSVLRSPGSAAQEEEPFLGMASVLYIPIVGANLLSVSLDTGQHAPVVLMLWSPIPNRWDHLPKEPVKNEPNTFSITLPELAPDTLAQKLTRLGDSHLFLENTHAFADAFFVGLLFSIDRALNDLGEAGKIVRERLIHGFLDLRDELFQSDNTTTSLRCWLETELATTLRAAFPLFFDQQRQLPVTLRIVGDPTPKVFPIGDLRQLFPAVPENVVLRVADDLASAVLSEATASVSPKGYREGRLVEVTVDVSARYCTITVRFKPSASDRQTIVGSGEAFFRYAATRRGLVVPASKDGIGLGLALYTRLPGRVGVYRRLYVSVDGSEWRVSTAIPIAKSISPQMGGEA